MTLVSRASGIVIPLRTKYTTPNAAHSALLTIDVQCDFTGAGGAAPVAGTSERVPAMRRIVAAYRNYRLPIVHVVRLYALDGTNVDLCRREMVELGKEIACPGTVGAELVPDLKPNPEVQLDADILLGGKLQTLGTNEWAMYKPRWDAFYETPLDRHLRSLAVNTVVVVGCNFANCPRATAYGASMRDFRAVLIPDAVSGAYDQGLQELNAIGIETPTSDQYINWLAESLPMHAANSAVT